VSMLKYFLHDAVYLYLRTVNQTLAEGYSDYRDGRLISKKTIGQRFTGKSLIRLTYLYCCSPKYNVIWLIYKRTMLIFHFYFVRSVYFYSAAALLAMRSAVLSTADLSASVCLSVTFRCFNQMNKDTIMRSSVSGSTMTLHAVSGKAKFIRTFAGITAARR